MIPGKINKIVNVVKNKSLKILGIERRKQRIKRPFIESFITMIHPSCLDVDRETIAIIVTGFLSELRKLPLEIVYSVINDGE